MKSYRPSAGQLSDSPKGFAFSTLAFYQHFYACIRQSDSVHFTNFISLDEFINFKMTFFGIRCCPVSMPWDRRLQTWTVVAWALLFSFSVPIPTLTLYFWIFHSNYLWPLALFYIAWCLYDLDTCNKGGRR